MKWKGLSLAILLVLPLIQANSISIGVTPSKATIEFQDTIVFHLGLYNEGDQDETFTITAPEELEPYVTFDGQYEVPAGTERQDPKYADITFNRVGNEEEEFDSYLIVSVEPEGGGTAVIKPQVKVKLHVHQLASGITETQEPEPTEEESGTGESGDGGVSGSIRTDTNQSDVGNETETSEEPETNKSKVLETNKSKLLEGRVIKKEGSKENDTSETPPEDKGATGASRNGVVLGQILQWAGIGIIAVMGVLAYLKRDMIIDTIDSVWTKIWVRL